jgi:hypothetical protein
LGEELAGSEVAAARHGRRAAGPDDARRASPRAAARGAGIVRTSRCMLKTSASEKAGKSGTSGSPPSRNATPSTSNSIGITYRIVSGWRRARAHPV